MPPRHDLNESRGQIEQQTIPARVRATNLWDRVGPGNYISDAHVTHNAGVGMPRC
jgi:hypothetical protein